MKFVIVGGAGAMGGVWASSLSAAGHDVSILDVATEAIDAINRNGLTIEESNGTSRVYRVPATDQAAKIGVCDAAIFFTKAHHTSSAVELAMPTIGPDTTVASLQNGWGNTDTLAEVVDPAQLAMGVTYHGATVLRPGIILHTLNSGPTFVGPYLDNQPLARARDIGAAMNEAGIQTSVTADVKTEIWKKLIINAAGLPVAALTRLNSGAMGSDEAILGMCESLIREAVVVAQAKGLAIDARERILAIRGLLAKGSTGRASMLQDVDAKRRTEIDVINGAIVREAAALGISVPLHSIMVALIKGLELSWAL